VSRKIGRGAQEKVVPKKTLRGNEQGENREVERKLAKLPRKKTNRGNESGQRASHLYHFRGEGNQQWLAPALLFQVSTRKGEPEEEVSACKRKVRLRERRKWKTAKQNLAICIPTEGEKTNLGGGNTFYRYRLAGKNVKRGARRAQK